MEYLESLDADEIQKVTEADVIQKVNMIKSGDYYERLTARKALATVRSRSRQ